MKNINKPRIIAMACLLALTIAACIGGGLAKYTQQVHDEGTGVPFEAALFENKTNDDGSVVNGFYLDELDTIMNTNGDYDNMDGNVTHDEYFMIPGTANLKYPYIHFNNKTEIPAYLYLVVEGTETDEDFFYEIFDERYAEEQEISSYNWKKINGSETGVLGTYVYVNNGDAVKLAAGTAYNAGIPGILGGMYVYITSLQKLTETKTISFTAYAIQAPGATVSVDDAKDVWDQMIEDKNSNKLDYLVDTTVKLTNTFTPGEVGAHIDEAFSGTAKTSIKIQNTGNVPALIRAKLVVNWVDDAGNIIANPLGADNSPISDPLAGKLDIGENGAWQEIEGYYYYKGYVAAGGKTAELLKASITAPETAGEYHMQVEVIAEAFQATGSVDPRVSGSETAVHNAWGRTFNGTSWQ